MAKTRGAYPPEFRHQMVELVRAGRTPEELADEFEPTAQSIRNWLAQSERNAGRGDGGLTTAEREELSRLRCENRQLRLEREILSNACPGLDPGRRPGSLGRRTRSHRRVPVGERSPGRLSNRHDVRAAGVLMTPSFSDGTEHLCEEGLGGEHLGEPLDEWQQEEIGHVRHEFVKHAPLTEQRMSAPPGRVGLECRS